MNGANSTTGAAAGSASRTGSFADALRRARPSGAEGAVRGGRAPRPGRAVDAARSARAERRAPAAELPLALAPAATLARDPFGAAGEPVPALASMLRAVPVLLAASRAAEGAPLALSFGRSLNVELRSGPAGVDLVLSPAAPLLGAARAELPQLVAALRAQGIRIRSAEIRPRREAPPRRGAR